MVRILRKRARVISDSDDEEDDGEPPTQRPRRPAPPRRPRPPPPKKPKKKKPPKKTKKKKPKKKIRYVAKRKLCDVLILLYFGNILYLIAIYSYLFLSILQPKGKWGGSRRRYTDRDMRRTIDLVRE